MTAPASQLESSISRAAAAIAAADALLIGAGAGMGVDSGLPDFRGDDGFWRAYPAFRDRGLSFVDLANPRWFRTDPAQAWGFYGHRLNLYRRTTPHAGFDGLLRLAESMPGGAFVFTSNVDGQFQRAGFGGERILECHGSIHHLQCAAGCHRQLWPADGAEIEVDEADFRAVGKLPTCGVCGGVARPNILMFGDGRWIERRTAEQEARLEAWLAATRKAGLVKIELGAGRAIPTVRMAMERLPGTLIRVNPREDDAPDGAISLPLGAREAIEQIGAFLAS